jgi:hypothetical protein
MVVERAPGCTAEQVGDRTLVVDAQGRQITTLNPVGSLVWWAIDGTRDLEALTAEVLRQTAGAEPDEIRRDVERFVADLADDGLVVPVDAPG